MKYLKYYENLSAFANEKDNVETPHVCVFKNASDTGIGYKKDVASNMKVSVNGAVVDVDDMFKDKINIEVNLCDDKYVELLYNSTLIGSNLKSMKVDGESVTPSTSYIFSTLGKHSIVLEYNADSLTSIDDEAFYGCSGLTSVTIPNSVTSIGYGAFEDCSGLTSVTIPDSVTSIDENAFCDCDGLTSVTIPNGVTSIGDAAFRYCSSLTSITIPSSATSISDNAFYYCSSLTSIIVDSNNSTFDSRNNCNAIIKTATNKLVVGCKNTIIPNSVTSIGNYAFCDCDGLTSVTIPNSVTSIGYCTFYGCSGLTSVTIPNSVTSIGNNAFYNVTKVIYGGTAAGSPWGARQHVTA